MVTFDYINIENKRLRFKAHIIQDTYTEGATIDKIYIGTQDNYSENIDVSKLSLLEYDINSDSVELEYTSSNLNIYNIDLEKDLIFLYIETTYRVETPNCKDYEKYTVGAYGYLYPIYRAYLPLVKEICNICEVPRELIDLALLIKAFKISIKLKDFIASIEYWKKLKNIKTITLKSCNCNG